MDLERMDFGDLVITQDVPLASEVVAQGGYGLNPRGSWYDEESVKSYLRRRNEREELREFQESQLRLRIRRFNDIEMHSAVCKAIKSDRYDSSGGRI